MLRWLGKLWRALLGRAGAFGAAHYLTGGPSLPAPLAPEEEKALLARMAAGDRGARDELICRNLRLVVYLSKKYESSGVPPEDLVSIGTIGLIKAVNTFTPARNIKLATYASRCIGNEILMYLRKTSSRRQEASIDEPLNVDSDGNELLLSDVLGTEEDQVGQRLEQDAERAVLDAAFAGETPPAPALGLRYLVCGTIAGRTLLPALPGAALARQSGGRLRREEGLLAAFCPGGEEEGWTALAGSELAVRLGL